MGNFVLGLVIFKDGIQTTLLFGHRFDLYVLDKHGFAMKPNTGYFYDTVTVALTPI